jgi:hypothetical protein
MPTSASSASSLRSLRFQKKDLTAKCAEFFAEGAEKVMVFSAVLKKKISILLTALTIYIIYLPMKTINIKNNDGK